MLRRRRPNAEDGHGRHGGEARRVHGQAGGRAGERPGPHRHRGRGRDGPAVRGPPGPGGRAQRPLDPRLPRRLRHALRSGAPRSVLEGESAPHAGRRLPLLPELRGLRARRHQPPAARLDGQRGLDHRGGRRGRGHRLDPLDLAEPGAAHAALLGQGRPAAGRAARLLHHHPDRELRRRPHHRQHGPAQHPGRAVPHHRLPDQRERGAVHDRAPRLGVRPHRTAGTGRRVRQPGRCAAPRRGHGRPARGAGHDRLHRHGGGAGPGAAGRGLELRGEPGGEARLPLLLPGPGRAPGRARSPAA